jgi:hypothetical protein
LERSIAAYRLAAELEVVFPLAGGPPRVLRMDNGSELAVNNPDHPRCGNESIHAT